VYPLKDIVEKNETQKKKAMFSSIYTIELCRKYVKAPRAIEINVPKKIPLYMNLLVNLDMGNKNIIKKFEIIIQSKSSPAHQNLSNNPIRFRTKEIKNKAIKGNKNIFLSRKVV